MKYSKEFIDEVKELYPESEEMNEMATNGVEFLGRYLNDSALGNIPIFTILSATSLDELQTIAKREKKKVDLYVKWLKETKRV